MPQNRLFKPFHHRYRRKKPPNLVRKEILFFSIVILIIVIAFYFPVRSFLKNVASQIALSDSIDLVTATVNDKLNEKMSQKQYTYDYFVTLIKDSDGKITAISANMARINTLSSEILQEVISSTDDGSLDIGIPVGNLLGSSLFLGRGPKVPIKIVMLTSSFADFKNELTSAGINQVKHQIKLEVRVEIDILMPWEVKTTEVLCEILVAETILVGEVPETYFNVNPS